MGKHRDSFPLQFLQAAGGRLPGGDFRPRGHPTCLCEELSRPVVLKCVLQHWKPCATRELFRTAAFAGSTPPK